MDLSHSYYPSGSGIAVPVSGAGFRWLGIVDLLALLAIVGGNEWNLQVERYIGSDP